MPVTITLASHGASSTQATEFTDNIHGISKTVCTKESQEWGKILQSSFADANLKDSNVLASANGLVHTALEAYNKQRHLTIRPEDVWFAILSQLGIWVNSNADEAGGKFITHDGKKDLMVTIQKRGDFDKVAVDATREIEKNVTDPKMREWIIPAFTTTTATDAVVASVLMMGTVPNHTSCLTHRKCGIPSITLLGEQIDWEELYKKLDKLETFGGEPDQFRTLLKPVISRFIESFHDPTSQHVATFWSHIVSAKSQNSGDGGSVEYEGWISAFCFWSELGEDMHDRYMQFRGSRGFTLDGFIYHNIDCRQIPPGYASLPVKIDDNGNAIDTVMVAGSMSTQYTTSDRPNTGSDKGLDSESPASGSGWWMLVRKKSAEGFAGASVISPEESADETESTTQTADPASLAMPEDGPITTATSTKKQSLITRLANVFSRTSISE